MLASERAGRLRRVHRQALQARAGIGVRCARQAQELGLVSAHDECGIWGATEPVAANFSRVLVTIERCIQR